MLSGQWVYRCLRGSCAAKGTLSSLASRFGEEQITTDMTFRRKLKTNETHSYTPPNAAILHPRSEKTDKYLLKRKISAATADACRICSTANETMAIPFYWQEKLVLIKYRNNDKPKDGQPKEWSEPGGLPVMWRIDEIDPLKPV